MKHLLLLLLSMMSMLTMGQTIEISDYDGRKDGVPYFAGPMSYYHVEIPEYDYWYLVDNDKNRIAKSFIYLDKETSVRYELEDGYFIKCTCLWKMDGASTADNTTTEQFAFMFGNSNAVLCTDLPYAHFGYEVHNDERRFSNVYLLYTDSGKEIYDFGTISVKGVTVESTMNGRCTYDVLITVYYQDTDYNYKVITLKYDGYPKPNSVSTRSANKLHVERIDNILSFENIGDSKVDVYDINGRLEGSASGTDAKVRISQSPIHIYKIKDKDGKVTTGKIK